MKRSLALLALAALALTGCTSSPNAEPPSEPTASTETEEANPNIAACAEFENEFVAMFRVLQSVPDDEPLNSRNDEASEHADNMETVAIGTSGDVRELMLTVVDTLPDDDKIHMVRMGPMFDGSDALTSALDRLGKQCVVEGHDWSTSIG